MDIAVSADQEAQLAELAARAGRSVNDVAADAVTRYLEEERRFAEAVAQGVSAADNHEFVAAHEVWARVERILKPRRIDRVETQAETGGR